LITSKGKSLIYEKQGYIYFVITKLEFERLKDDVEDYFRSKYLVNLFIQGYQNFNYKFRVHSFFVPEVYFIFKILQQKYKREIYNIYLKELETNTWFANTFSSITSRVDSAYANSKLNITLKPHQQEFIDLYLTRKLRYNLRGQLLAFGVGLGKTATAIFLMEALKKDIIIVSSLKTIIQNTWNTEILKFYKDKNTPIWNVGDPPKNAHYYLVNFESIDKVLINREYFNNKRVGLVLDESHFFTSENALRVAKLKNIIDTTSTLDDVLLMSGTPIRAIGSDLIPTLSFIDPLFDKEAADLFKKVFGVNNLVGVEVLQNRLGLIMHKRTSEQTLKLPEKHQIELKIKIADGSKYTLEQIKIDAKKFIEQRMAFYLKDKQVYEKRYYEILDKFADDYFQGDNLLYKPQYLEYLNKIKYVKMKVNWLDPVYREHVKSVNSYEKDIILPNLSSSDKKEFKNIRSIVKYVELKVNGEFIGGFLNKLRSELFKKMFKASNLSDIITKSKKKTLAFTTYVDVAKDCFEYLKSETKLNPLIITGENSSDSRKIFEIFKKDDKYNPIIATVQTLGTGVTLIEANTLIFLNPVWRSIEKEQVEGRVWRIGQEDEVFIYTLSLDTGNEPNLSTRMDDILAWSKEMVDSITNINTLEENLQILEKLDNLLFYYNNYSKK